MIGLLLGADLTAKAYAQSRLEHEIDTHSGADLQVHAQIHSFPFLGRLAVSQEVSALSLQSNDVKAGGIDFTNVRLSMHRVKVDRNKLIAHQHLVITGIGRTSASADLTAASLQSVLPGVTDLQIAAGKVTMKVAGRTISADVAVAGNQLVLKVAGLPLPSFALPGTDLLPCLGGLQVGEGRIHFSCTVNGIPQAVLKLVNGVAASQ